MEIKFKAKRLDGGEWVEGYYYKECDNTYIIEDRQNESMLNRNETVLVDPSTVCQYTGLMDLKGRKIWEHDNVTDFPHYGEVVYKNGCFFMHNEAMDLPLYDNIGRVQGFDSFGRCLVTNQGSKFDRKEEK